MKKHFIISILLLFAVNLVISQVVVTRSDQIRSIGGKEYYIHPVEPGQTLYSISKAYQVPVDEIRFENPSLKEGLKAFQQIRIPVQSRDVAITEKIKEGKADFIYHIARRDESFSDIALIYDVPEELVRNANPDITASLKEGQYVRIPLLRDDEKDLADENLVRHQVEPGETFFSLSRKFNIPVEEIRKANEGVPYPRAGGQILIPVVPGKETQEKRPDIFEYEVKPGETLYGVAKKFHTSIDSIRSYNFGLVDDINAGQTLNIPYRPDDKEFIVHRVDERRTSLRRLARKYEVEVDEIKGINPRLDNRVRYNQAVKIPVEEEAYVPLVLQAEKAETEPEEIEPEERTEPCYARFIHDDVYKVALMLPLYLEEIEFGDGDILKNPDNSVNFLPFQFIQFYQGFLMAADSLAKEGFRAEVYVYDVDQQISKTIKVLQQEELKDMDLIIGPLFRTSFKYVSNFAELFDIKIVNPLSQSDDILTGNRNVFKIMPSQDVQPWVLRRLIDKDFKNHRVMLVRHNTYQDNAMAEAIRNAVLEAQPPDLSMNNALLWNTIKDISRRAYGEEDYIPPVEWRIEGKKVIADLVQITPDGYTQFPNDVPEIVYMDDSLRGIVEAASVIRPNLIIALSDSEVFAIDLLTSELREEADDPAVVRVPVAIVQVVEDQLVRRDAEVCEA